MVTTLERIRESASTLFAERGYAGTSMSRLAGKVGVRKASLYNYYPSKEALLQDLVARGIRSWRDACEPALHGEGDPNQRLRSYFYGIFEFVDSDPETVALIRFASTQIGGSLGKRCRGLAVEEQRRILATFSALCRRAMDCGQMEETDVEEVVLMWTAVVDGILINKIFDVPQGARYDDHLEVMWRRLWRAMGGLE